VAGAERITWVGHATVALEIGGARLLTDPVLRSRVAHLRRHAPPPDPHVLAGLDAVLVSHMHLDHLDVPSLRMLGRDVRVIVPRGAGAVLERAGFARVTELGVGEETSVADATVTAVEAEHDGRRHPLGPAAETLGFEIAGEHRVYFAGDTDIFPGMEALAGRHDLALLPIWGWGPTLGPGHMDPEAAARAAALLRPRVVVPIHWGTLFPAGLRRFRGAVLVAPPLAFERLVEQSAIDVEVRTLAPGESLDLDDPPVAP
jgi:L-ascorbate metabolism protein UlaG (beta-lactamase superfamily)